MKGCSSNRGVDENKEIMNTTQFLYSDAADHNTGLTTVSMTLT